MRYDGQNPLHARQARERLEKLIRDGKLFDLTEKKPPRTLSQNAYLHVILAYFAAQQGETEDYVKREYYKRLVNPALYIRERDDPFLGHIRYLRSSAELDTAEMTLSIDRFRNWAAAEAGIYLPSPDESRLVALMELEVERHKAYL